MKNTYVVNMSIAASVLLNSAFANDSSAPSLSHLDGKVPFFTTQSEEFVRTNSNIHPFINSSISAPSDYSGGLFELNHQYPEELPPSTGHYPWKQVTSNGPITQKNAGAYVEALKEYVSADMRKILFDANTPNLPNWYQSIWLGTEREPIHGMYVGSTYPAGTLPGQSVDLTTYVYTLYDSRAATTLGDIWGTTENRAMNPVFDKASTQYAEGSVIVKFAFVTPCGSDWPAMKNAAIWQIYAPVNSGNGSAQSSKSKCRMNGSDGSSTTPTITNVYLMQFDIIVKDSVAAPDTGWVFSTLVYDKDASGKDAWDKMIPLGATWGGNPNVVNLAPEALTPPVRVNPALSENWINMQSPLYSRATLGWDGRLSGPNDGAVVTPAWANAKYYHLGLASAGCLGCHSSAQYPMTSFLLPTASTPPSTISAPLSSNSASASLVMSEPGSPLWMKWFQSRNGYTPMGPETSRGQEPIALDYDMVTAFKAIPMGQAALKSKNN